MGNRKLPFGYQMRMGEIVRNEPEAKAVQDIFLQYTLGASLKEIAEQMRKTGPVYDEGKSWNKNMIARILENPKYTGADSYPKLVDIKLFEAAVEKRQTKQRLPERTPAQKALKRVCSKPSTPEIEQQVMHLLSRLAEQPERITQPERTSAPVHTNAQAGLDDILNTQPLDEDAARSLICKLAQEQYDDIGNEEYETERLRRLFTAFECTAELNAELLQSAVSAVLVTLAAQKRTDHWKGRFGMTDEKPRVIIIPPKPELQQTAAVTKQLRVAAYCRVSTKEEEQASSYEAQCEYYTDKIMSNKEWTMAGIFADEGITGTSTKKRTEFLRMIRLCKQKKIDLILTKSIQRFARNTLDCINYTRILRQLGIGVLFEKENINSLPPDSEFMITMYGAMAQSESESISGNIRRGRQMHAKVGTLKVPCYRLYGYEKDTEGKFRVIPEQAEIVRELYKRYESGASLRNLQDWLEENQIKTVLGESKWTTTSIKSILTNEKYCGDVLLQKTFRTDVISKKVIKNIGQMAQYYMPDHHEAIVSREQYNAVKAEMARRSALRSSSKTAVTGRSCYTSKYALSDRLVCGECGTLYRRCTWTSLGRKYPVWRCTSRLNYGTKYCHDSPTIKEEPLQAAILVAINSAMSGKPALLDRIRNAVSLELLPVQGQTMSLADIESRLVQLDEQFQSLLAEAIDAEDKEACNAQFAEILAEQTALKKQKEEILRSSTDADRVCTRMKQAEEAIENTAQIITEWNENAVRQIVERVTVLSADEVLVRIKGGAEIKQRME